MGDDPSLVALQFAVALIALVASVVLAGLALTRPPRVRPGGVGAALLVTGALLWPLIGVAALLPMAIGAVVSVVARPPG